MQPDQSIQAPPRTGGARNLSTILSAVAVVLAAGALVAALSIPGPAGPQGTAGAAGANGTNGAVGPAGPQGPAGKGTITASFFQTNSSILTTACTSVANVTITVTGPGQVVFSASATFGATHSLNTADEVSVYTSPIADTCWDSAGVYVIPATAPSDSYYFVISVTDTFGVSAAGTHTYYLVPRGFGSTFFDFGHLNVVFYPS